MIPPEILAEPVAVRIHLATIAVAMLATAILLPLRKGTRLHKVAGWVWVAAMLTTSCVSFAIPSDFTPWGLGPIHIFSVIVAWSVPRAILSVRRGDVEAHRKAMQSVCAGALGITGVLTLAPGRLLGGIVFGW